MHKVGCDEGGGREVGKEKVKRMRRVDGEKDRRTEWRLAAGYFFFFEDLWAGTLTEMTHSSFLSPLLKSSQFSPSSNDHPSTLLNII